MKDTLTVRALVVLAVTNPLVWALVVLAVMLAVCGLVVALYWLVFEYARNELFPPRPCSRPNSHRFMYARVPVEEDWPILPPSPEVVAHLDEHGRIELVVRDPLSGLPLEQETAQPVPSSPRPAPSAARTARKPKPYVAPATLFPRRGRAAAAREARDAGPAVRGRGGESKVVEGEVGRGRDLEVARRTPLPANWFSSPRRPDDAR